MKQKRLLIAAAVLVFVATVAIIYCYNPFAPRTLDAMLSKEWGRMRGKVSNADGMTSLTRAQVARKYQRNWDSIADSMRGSGASDEEVRGVLATARKHFSSRSEDKDFIYGVPVTAKRIWYHFQPVWIIKFGWGVGSEDAKTGMTEPPNHSRVLGISARKPYKLLGMQTCC